MQSLWGPCTDDYLAVLSTRVKFFCHATLKNLQDASLAFESAAANDDLFVRWELRDCTAHPLRRIKDVEVTQNLGQVPPNVKELAAKGYVLPFFHIPDEQRKAIWPYLSSHSRHQINLTLKALSLRATEKYDLAKLYLLSDIYHVPVIQKMVLDSENPDINKHLLLRLGRLFRATCDIGVPIEIPLSWKAHTVFQYGVSDFTRRRLRSSSTKLLCVRVDNACRRAILYWLWAPLPVVKDIKRMIAEMIWESRYDVHTWTGMQGCLVKKIKTSIC